MSDDRPPQSPPGTARAEAASRPRATPAERLRFALILVAVLAVLAAVFGIVRIMQQNNSQRTYEDCLDRAAQQGSSQPDSPTVPRPEEMCQRPD